jgi:hypothetical protein
MQSLSEKNNKNELIAGVVIGSLFGVALGAIGTTVVEHIFLNGLRTLWNKVVLRRKDFDPRWLLQ